MIFFGAAFTTIFCVMQRGDRNVSADFGLRPAVSAGMELKLNARTTQQMRGNDKGIRQTSTGAYIITKWVTPF